MSSMMPEDDENQQQQPTVQRLGQRWMLLGHVTDAWKRFSRVLRRLRSKASCASDEAMCTQLDWSNTEYDDDWFEEVAKSGIHEGQWREACDGQTELRSAAATTGSAESSVEVEDHRRLVSEPAVHHAGVEAAGRPAEHGASRGVRRQQQQQEEAASAENGYKGIRRYKTKWVTEIRPTRENSTIWLGSYQSPRAAARAFDVGTFYCNKKRKHAYNFPDSIDHLPPATRSTGFLPRNERYEFRIWRKKSLRGNSEPPSYSHDSRTTPSCMQRSPISSRVYKLVGGQAPPCDDSSID